MKLSQVKTLLPTLENVAFKLENGTFVPEHFHVTKVGMVTKNFIDKRNRKSNCRNCKQLKLLVVRQIRVVAKGERKNNRIQETKYYHNICNCVAIHSRF